MPETQDTRDVCEFVLATMLAAAGTMLIKWIGKRYLGMDESTREELHVHNYIGEAPPEEECGCEDCVAKKEKPA